MSYQTSHQWAMNREPATRSKEMFWHSFFHSFSSRSKFNELLLVYAVTEEGNKMTLTVNYIITCVIINSYSFRANHSTEYFPCSFQIERVEEAALTIRFDWMEAKPLDANCESQIMKCGVNWKGKEVRWPYDNSRQIEKEICEWCDWISIISRRNLFCFIFFWSARFENVIRNSENQSHSIAICDSIHVAQPPLVSVEWKNRRRRNSKQKKKWFAVHNHLHSQTETNGFQMENHMNRRTAHCTNCMAPAHPFCKSIWIHSLILKIQNENNK